MLVRTDDEVYRVDSVWLGPPRATFPWRARYVSYGVGLLVMIVIMFLQRRIGIGLDFFSVAWSLVLTVLITRFLGKRIDYERPLGQVAALFRHEVTGPRRRRAAAGGPVRFAHVRTRRGLPGGRSRRGGGTGGPGRPERSIGTGLSTGGARPPSPPTNRTGAAGRTRPSSARTDTVGGPAGPGRPADSVWSGSTRRAESPRRAPIAAPARRPAPQGPGPETRPVVARVPALPPERGRTARAAQPWMTAAERRAAGKDRRDGVA